MRKTVTAAFVSLDGVMQAPTRGGAVKTGSCALPEPTPAELERQRSLR